MINLNIVSLALLTLLLLLILVLCYLDYKKKRTFTKRPFLSFLIPCYNDGDTIQETIESIYNSYDKSKFEIIVINDCSKDNSLAIIKKLQRKYDFKLINNKKNLGKARSINNISSLAKSEIMFVIDADLLINKKALENVLSRFESDQEVCAVSCPYKIINKGLFGRMQEMECNMMSFAIYSHNRFSAMSLWGGCLAVKKNAFEKVGKFSENMLTEDIDLAFKLTEKKMKVEHATYSVSTYGEDTIKSWYKQKQRWVAGGTQCYLKHFKVWLKHPLQVIFIVLFSVLSILFIVFLIKESILFDKIWKSYELLRQTTAFILSLKITGLYYGFILIRDFLVRTSFSLYSVPYTVPMINNFKQVYKVLYVLPYSLVYYPIFSFLSIIWFIKGVISYAQLKEKKRAW